MQTKSTPKVCEKKSQEYGNNSETNRKPSVKVEQFVQLPCPQMDEFQPFEKKAAQQKRTEVDDVWALMPIFPTIKVETPTQAPFVTSKTIQNHTKPIKTTSYCAECWNCGAIIEWASQQVSDGSQLSREMETRRLKTHGSSKVSTMLSDSLLWSLHHLRLCVRLFMSGLALYSDYSALLIFSDTTGFGCIVGFKWACEGGVGRVSALQNPRFQNLA